MLLILSACACATPLLCWAAQNGAKDTRQEKKITLAEVTSQIAKVQEAINTLNDQLPRTSSETLRGDIQQALTCRAGQLEMLQYEGGLLAEIDEIKRFQESLKNILSDEENGQLSTQVSALYDQLGESPAAPGYAACKQSADSSSKDPVPASVNRAGVIGEESPKPTAARLKLVSNGSPGNSPTATNPLAGTDPAPAKVQTPMEPGGEFARTIIGYEQAGASAAAIKQNLFVDLFLSSPLTSKGLFFHKPKSRDYDFGPRWRTWGDIRVSSVPLQNTAGNVTVSNFLNGGFAQQAGNLKVNEVVQAAEFLAGIEVRLGGIRRPLPSFAAATKEKFSFSIFLGGGAITPLTPLDSRQVFVATSEANSSFNLPATTQFIAFVNPDRDRFFRQYYGGLRLKTHYYEDCNQGGLKLDEADYHCLSAPGSTERLRPENRFPATLDFGIGFNESVTGGRLHGAVIRVDGFYPLPWETSQFVYLYGTALMKPRRAIIANPLVLAAAPDTTAVPGQNVAIVPIPQIDRDYYRIGVGVDLIGFIKTLTKSAEDKNQQDKSK